MKVKLLDEKVISENKGCLLCRVSLKEYIDSLPEDFDKYEIQRNIVNNKYLDSIFDTVINDGHIPIITLVMEGDFQKSENELVIDRFRILDGLQRSWRLNGVLVFLKWLKESYPTMVMLKDEFIDVRSISLPTETRKKILEMGISDLKQARNIASKIFEIGSYQKVLEHIENNVQWIEIWYGLEEKEIIYKMLLLNAGHKTMSARHQIELLFYNWIDAFSSVVGVKIIREKEEASSVSFVNGREPKTYKFSDLVLATLAFQNGRINEVNSSIIEKSFIAFDSLLINSDNIYYKDLIEFVAKLDMLICRTYGDEGRRWYGRGNNLEALMAAVGRWCLEQNENRTDSLLKKCFDIFQNRYNGLDIDHFEEGKGQLIASKVNIGQKTKMVVFDAFYEFISGDNDRINWIEMFAE